MNKRSIKNIYIPKLRFMGFDKKYKNVKLKDISTYKKGKDFSKKDLDDNGKNPIILYGDLFTQYTAIIKNINQFTNESGGYLSKRNTLLFPSSSTSLNDFFSCSAIDIENVILGSDINIFEFNVNNSAMYFSYLFSTPYHLKNIFKLTEGSTINHLYGRYLESYNLMIPEINEQNKVAKFFSLLDQQILLLENKLQLIEQKLKYFINKLLKTYNGFPKIRFKGFNNIWMNDYIENIFDITRGLVIAKNKIIKESNGKFCYPVYSSQTENDGLMGYYNEYLYENAITWTTDGAKAGTVNYRNKKFYCSNVCGVLLEKEYKPNLCFSLIIQRESKKYVIKDLGNPKLMNNVMAKIKIYFPYQIEEQEKISHFLNLFKIQQKLINNQLVRISWKKEYFLKSMFIYSIQKGGDNYDRNSFQSKWK